jgi:phage terminase large subunit
MGVKHGTTLAYWLGSALRKRHGELQPPETDADRVKRYANDPVGFARDVLHICPWSRQRQILESVLKYKRVSVVSGHKVAKSTSYAILALWFYCSFPGARVIITATTDRQVNGIIWREIKRLIRGAAVKIPGAAEMGIKAFTGITDPHDFSEIRGYTAKEAEAIAGVSGEYVLYLVDEASGVKDFIFQAIEGNRAAGNAWALLASNPTKADGEFYDSHHSKSRKVLGDDAGYEALHIDSRESPNVTGEWREMDEWSDEVGGWVPRTRPVPGLCGPDWIRDKLREWGESDPRFKVRIAGLFCVAEEAKIFQLSLIEEMHANWHDVEPEGRLWIGVDPSGDASGGDEGGFCARRGLKVLELRARSGLVPAAYCAEIDDIIGAHWDGDLQPVVLIESEGDAGWKVYQAVKLHAETAKTFICVRIRTSDKAHRQPLIFDRMRDELWANARAWGRSGGGIPESIKLEDDLHAPEYKQNDRGLLKVTPKKDLKILLGRSPDIGDAFVLSCWEPMSLRAATEVSEAAAPPGGAFDFDAPEATFNPYGGGFV